MNGNRKTRLLAAGLAALSLCLAAADARAGTGRIEAVETVVELAPDGGACLLYFQRQGHDEIQTAFLRKPA